MDAGKKPWQRVALGLLLTSFLSAAGFLFGMVVVTAMTGALYFHPTAEEIVVADLVLFGSVAVSSLVVGIFAWKAPLSSVRTATAIVGVVFTSAVALGVWIIWSELRLSGLLPLP